MANRPMIVLGVVLLAAGAGYLSLRPAPVAPISGVVRVTQVRIAPEVSGQLAAIKVRKGDTVRAGDVVAELSAAELAAQVGQARATLAAAIAARNNVYAGVRAEQIAALAAETAKANSQLEYAEQQLSRISYLARSDTATQQSLDQATKDVAATRADVAEAFQTWRSACADARRRVATAHIARGCRFSPPPLRGRSPRSGGWGVGLPGW